VKSLLFSKVAVSPRLKGRLFKRGCLTEVSLGGVRYWRPARPRYGDLDGPDPSVDGPDPSLDGPDLTSWRAIWRPDGLFDVLTGCFWLFLAVIGLFLAVIGLFLAVFGLNYGYSGSITGIRAQLRVSRLQDGYMPCTHP